MRYKDISTANFLKFVTLMEKKISNILLRDGSFLKFLFKVIIKSTFFFNNSSKFKNNDTNSWFTLFQDSERDKIVIQPISSGPWEYHDQLFINKDEIYLSKDIFYYKDEEHQKLTERLYDTITSIAENVNSSFKDCDPSSIWDLFLINYEYNSFMNMANRTFESQAPGKTTIREPNSKSNSLPNEIVNNMMLVVLNYQGKACENESADDNKTKLLQKEKTLNKSKSKLKIEKKENNLSDAFKSMKEEKFSNRLMTVNNILKKMESTYFRDKFQKEEDRIRGTSNLPFSYVVEMIKDVNDILILYKDNLISKVASALYAIKDP